VVVAIGPRNHELIAPIATTSVFRAKRERRDAPGNNDIIAFRPFDRSTSRAIAEFVTRVTLRDHASIRILHY
jgi:hypothetical protein